MRRSSVRDVRALFATALAAIKRGDFAKARLVLRRIIAAKGPGAQRARTLLQGLERLRARKKNKKKGSALKKKTTRPAKSGGTEAEAKPPWLPPSRFPPLEPHGSSEGDEFEPEEFRRSPFGSRGWAGGDFGDKGDKNVRHRYGYIREDLDRSLRHLEIEGPRQPSEFEHVVERIPHLRPTTDTPALGSHFFVDVYANTEAGGPLEQSDPLRLLGILGQTQFDVEVWMPDTEHFTVVSTRDGVLKIFVDRNDSEPVRFEVEVSKAASEHDEPTLFAYFYYHGRPCGKVSRRISIGGEARVGGASGGPPRDRIEIDADAELADITVDITDPRKTRQHLEAKIRSRLLAPHEQPAPGAWDLPSESGEMVDFFMKKFTRGSKDDRLRALGSAGETFFKASPREFQELYWKLIDRGTPPKSILVTSEEPYVPWELMVPVRHLADGTRETQPQPLGVQCIVGRWIHEDHVAPRPKIPLTSSYVVAPDYPGPSPMPLTHAANEVNVVLSTVKGDRITPADLDTLDVRLGAEGRSLLHLVCHGANSPGLGVQCIYLDGGIDELSSLDVSQLKGLLAAFRQKPLVFLNACEVGRPTISLSGIGGFAGAFIDIGAAAVIAPLWSVRDGIAYDVALRFYEAVKGAQSTGRPYADILREIRARAYDPTIAEDTYAAYCFYGDPFATP